MSERKQVRVGSELVIVPTDIEMKFTGGAVAFAWLELQRAMIGPSSDRGVGEVARAFADVVALREKQMTAWHIDQQEQEED